MSSSISMRTIIADIGKVLTGYRSSHWRCSRKKDYLKDVVNFTRKHLRQSLLLIQFIKKRLQQKCFPVKSAKVLRTPILQNICERLLPRIFQKELLNFTSSRFLQFNECLWTFQVFFLQAVYPSWHTSTKPEQCIFIIYDSAGRERTKFSTNIKIIELHYPYKQSDPPTDNCMPKVISDHTENVKVYINVAFSFS